MKVLVLGNSHAATLRSAFPAIQTAFPDFSLSFWGLPGAAFDKASAGPDGVLRPDDQDLVAERKVLQWNATATVDTRAFDAIYLVGLRYGLRAVMQMCRSLQPLEWGRRNRALGVSLAFLRAGIRAEVQAHLANLTRRIPMDSRFALMPAPYPATTATEEGTGFEAVTRALAGMKTAPALMALFEQEIEAAHAALGLRLVPQPRDTLARPWLTDARFLQDSAQDARHMNADYGLIAFRALAAPPITAAAAFAPTAQKTA
jgi:hypothetical protein